MRKIILALALSCSACAGVLTPPATCSRSTVDDKGIVLALETYDTVLTSIDQLEAAGVIRKGSPKAVALAAALHKTTGLFRAALDAQRACSATDYISLITQAQASIAEITRIMKGS